MNDSKFINGGYYRLGSNVVRFKDEMAIDMVYGDDIIYGNVFLINSRHKAKPIFDHPLDLEKGKSYPLSPISLCKEFFDEQPMFIRVTEDFDLTRKSPGFGFSREFRQEYVYEPTGRVWFVSNDRNHPHADRLDHNLFIAEVAIDVSCAGNKFTTYVPFLYYGKLDITRMRPLKYVHELQQMLDLFHVEGTASCGEMCDDRDRLAMMLCSRADIPFTFNYLKHEPKKMTETE